MSTQVPRSSKPRKSLVKGVARSDLRKSRKGTGRTTTNRVISIHGLQNAVKDVNGFEDLSKAFGSSEELEELPKSSLNLGSGSDSEDPDVENVPDDQVMSPIASSPSLSLVGNRKSPVRSIPSSSVSNSSLSSSSTSSSISAIVAVAPSDLGAPIEVTPAKRLDFDSAASPAKSPSRAEASSRKSKRSSASSDNEEDAGDSEPAEDVGDSRQPDASAAFSQPISKSSRESARSPVPPPASPAPSIDAVNSSPAVSDPATLQTVAKPSGRSRRANKQSKPASTKSASGKAEATNVSGAKKSRSRRTTMGLIKDAIEAGVVSANGDGRRSKRVRFAPMPYWTTTRFEYERTNDGLSALLPTINPGKIIPPANPSAVGTFTTRSSQVSSGNSNRSRKRKHRASVKDDHPSSSDDEDDEELSGLKEEANPKTRVYDRRTDKMVEISTSKTSRMLVMETLEMPGPGSEPQPRSLYPSAGKFFQEREFSCGLLVLPPGCVKFKETTISIEIFYAVKCKPNALEVQIMNTTHILSKSDSFFVPLNNEYMLRNRSKKHPITLYFTLVHGSDEVVAASDSSSSKKH